VLPRSLNVVQVAPRFVQGHFAADTFHILTVAVVLSEL